MARGISTPRTDSGPESCQSTIVNDTSDTIAFTAPTARVTELTVKVLMSSWMRWSGLSTGAWMNRLRW